jgi:hypothetical protein
MTDKDISNRLRQQVRLVGYWVYEDQVQETWGLGRIYGGT